MADIKKRDFIKGKIKTADKASTATERIRSAYIQTKEKAETSTNPIEQNAEEYASGRLENGANRATHETVHGLDIARQKGVEKAKKKILKTRNDVREFRKRKGTQSVEKQVLETTHNRTLETMEQAEKTVKQSARSAGKQTIKTTGKTSVKTAKKAVKTAERTYKTTQQAAKTTQKTAQVAKKTERAAIRGTKLVVKATVKTIKAIIDNIATIATGGGIAVIVIILICLLAAIGCSAYGIFFSAEETESDITIRSVVQEINTDYDMKLDEIKSSNAYDVLEMSGSRAIWKDVLALYSVKTNNATDNPQEVVTMDENKKNIITEIFWDMNTISYRIENKTENELKDIDDGYGNIVQIKTMCTKNYLYITVSHKTVDEMSTKYGFNQEQKGFLTDLLDDKNNSLWNSVLYGITMDKEDIVTIAQSQIGNVGGQPYWSWYGCNNRIEWCACFVSWCANECGYIDSGIIPKYAGCLQGSDWFKERNQWADRNITPKPGMIIFFDWDKDGVGQNGLPDHTGIVEKVENGRVYTIEGNSKDSCKENSYTIGYYEIYGYGCPIY